MPLMVRVDDHKNIVTLLLFLPRSPLDKKGLPSKDLYYVQHDNTLESRDTICGFAGYSSDDIGALLFGNTKERRGEMAVNFSITVFGGGFV